MKNKRKAKTVKTYSKRWSKEYKTSYISRKCFEKDFENL